MKRALILLGALALFFTLSLKDLAAQQLGDNATIIVPTGKITAMRQVLVVKAPPEPTATTVGNCVSGDVHFQNAELVDREPPPGKGWRGTSKSLSTGPAGKIPTVATKVAIILPGAAGFKELKPGWHLGAYRAGGKCGPGYDIYLAQIIAIK